MANPLAPIDVNELWLELKANGWPWQSPSFITSVDSTNRRLVESNPAEGAVLIAGEQTQGRGRGTNQWWAPFGTSVLMSVVVRPTAPIMAWPWVGVIMALAARSALREATNQRVDLALKWPNDLMARPAQQNDVRRRKVGGVLSEVSGQICVVGIGINVFQDEAQLEFSSSLDDSREASSEIQATSLSLLTTKVPTLSALVGGILAHFHLMYGDWNSLWQPEHDEAVRTRYLSCCETIGQNISCTLAGQQVLAHAIGVNRWGQLLVESPEFGTLELDSALVSNLRVDS